MALPHVLVTNARPDGRASIGRTQPCPLWSNTRTTDPKIGQRSAAASQGGQ